MPGPPEELPTDDPPAGLRPRERPVFTAAACISSNASQYFFLCGELLYERQMAFRKRSNSASSMISGMPPHVTADASLESRKFVQTVGFIGDAGVTVCSKCIRIMSAT